MRVLFLLVRIKFRRISLMLIKDHLACHTDTVLSSLLATHMWVLTALSPGLGRILYCFEMRAFVAVNKRAAS